MPQGLPHLADHATCSYPTCHSRIVSVSPAACRADSRGHAKSSRGQKQPYCISAKRGPDTRAGPFCVMRNETLPCEFWSERAFRASCFFPELPPCLGFVVHLTSGPSLMVFLYAVLEVEGPQVLLNRSPGPNQDWPVTDTRSHTTTSYAENCPFLPSQQPHLLEARVSALGDDRIHNFGGEALKSSPTPATPPPA